MTQQEEYSRQRAEWAAWSTGEFHWVLAEKDSITLYKHPPTHMKEHARWREEPNDDPEPVRIFAVSEVVDGQVLWTIRTDNQRLWRYLQ